MVKMADYHVIELWRVLVTQLLAFPSSSFVIISFYFLSVNYL